MKIEVVKDTKIIEENTKDALQVKIEQDRAVSETSITIDGKIIKGDNLVVTDVSYANLGKIKERLLAIEQEIAQLNLEADSLTATKGLIEPELDKAISDILKEPESMDKRSFIIKQ